MKAVKETKNIYEGRKHLKVHYADLKISLYVCVHVKTIPWQFRILNPKSSPVICS